jgi:hypothetical protein
VAALALESPADREVRIMGHDARGLIVAAVDAWALSVNICRQLGRIAWGGRCVSSTSAAVVQIAGTCLTCG